MIRISALNEESHESSGCEEEVTREALEQIALQQYTKALELLRKGEEKDALQLLKDLLDTELLNSITKPGPGEKITTPLFNLKYLCYKNIASILSTLNSKEEAIEAYIDASLLDDTDVTLWHRLGVLCIDSGKYDLALQAFQRGVTCNKKHWPCIDKIIVLLYGLGYYKECIERIYTAFEFDPYYLRGIVYQREIYANFPYIKEYLCHNDKKYEFEPQCEEEIDEETGKKLLEEALVIHNQNLEELRSNTFVFRCPNLRIRNTIIELSWVNLFKSVVDMHKYMTENSYSHASLLDLVCQVETKETTIENIPLITPENLEINKTDTQTTELNNGKAEENNIDDDVICLDETNTEPVSEVINEHLEAVKEKDLKKTVNRRRGSELSILEPWEWYTRKSSRKKMNTKQDRVLTIYDILRRRLPNTLLPPEKSKQGNIDDSPDSMDTFKIEESRLDSKSSDERTKSTKPEYFGTVSEEKDVKQFIEEHNQSKSDIISILKDMLEILSRKWDMSFPDDLLKLFDEANTCLKDHFDKPSITSENYIGLENYTYVNLLCEEIQLMNDDHNIDVVQFLDMFLNNPSIFKDNYLNLYIRFLWYKCNLYLKQNYEDLALDCLIQLRLQFTAMGTEEETFKIELPNFSKGSVINKAEVDELIVLLERNKKLSRVLPLYRNGDLEEALEIVCNCFEECKCLAQKGFYDEIALDWAIQLSLILDCFWSLGKSSDCFKWAAKCLNESLKHYFQWKNDSKEGEKWTLVVIKCLACLEHILRTEGTNSLEVLDDKQLSDLVEEVIQIIGQQVEESSSENAIDVVTPWIILHYVLQREEDHGRDKKIDNIVKGSDDEIPNALSILFIGHEHLGKKSWCCNSEGALLYFILDTVLPRLRSPALARPMELISHYLEQCVFCLFGHPNKKTKLKYLEDHNVNPHKLDWTRAQQLYEIFRPVDLPEIEGKMPSISADVEQLFQRILAFMPEECQPQKHVADMVKYIDGRNANLPILPLLMPYKMKDIFYILGDYYFKKDERSKSIKFNLYDVIVNNDRFESWAELALAKGANLEQKVNSCDEMKSDMEFLAEAECTERCYKRALDLDPMQYTIWIEYGSFAYTMHSFCSRSLKQESASLRMEDYQKLAEKKEYMLDRAHKCFSHITQQLNESDASDSASDELWLQYYLLGKIAEKRTKSPSGYLDLYIKAGKCLLESKACYPTKINYNAPQNLSLEALEINYRIHASILKYVEQHEHKVIHSAEAKLFLRIIEECANGPFGKKKPKPVQPDEKIQPESSQIAGGVKRSASDGGDESPETKRTKIDNGIMMRRASAGDISTNSENASEHLSEPSKSSNVDAENKAQTDECKPHGPETKKSEKACIESKPISAPENKPPEIIKKCEVPQENNAMKVVTTNDDERRISADTICTATTTATSSDGSSSDSSDSSSESSDSEDDGDKTVIVANVTPKAEPATDNDIMEIINNCLEALEDCVSRFPTHYKALFRLAHYHFYYKKGKDIERCRDLMLSSFQSKLGQKLQGLFTERKNNNFFNNIWRIPSGDIDRAGSFAFHMGRCVLLSMEILKEIDDHKTLLDLSIQLHKTPEPDKKYLRDSERKEVAQQAFSLCVQSLKGKLMKFAQQEDLKSNDVEMKAFNSLMLDIYRSYLRAQKQPNSKQLSSLLADGYKMCTTNPILENTNVVDAGMRYCQGLIAALKQQAADRKKETKTTTKNVEPKPSSLPKSKSVSIEKSSAKAMTPQEITAALQRYLPAMSLSDPMLTQQTVAALSLQRSLSYMSQAAPLPENYAALEQALQHSFQSEFCRQYLAGNLQAKLAKPAKLTKSKSAAATSSSFNYSNKSVHPHPSTSQHNMGAQTANKSLSSTLPKNLSSNFDKSKPKQLVNAHSSNQTSGVGPFIPPGVSMPFYSTFDTNVKPAHISSTSAAYTSSATNVKPAHQNKSTKVSTSVQTKSHMPHEQVTNVIPAHISSTNTAYTSAATSVKPAHQNTSAKVSAAVQAKPRMLHEQVTKFNPAHTSTNTACATSSTNAKTAHQNTSTKVSATIQSKQRLPHEQVTNVKPAHISSTKTSYTSSATNFKPAHQNTSTTVTAAIQAKPRMPQEQVTNVKPAHMSSTNIVYNTSATYVKPAHQHTTTTVSAAIQVKPPLRREQVTNVNPAHMSISTAYTTSATNVKPAHQNTSTTVSAAIQAKPPMPRQQVANFKPAHMSTSTAYTTSATNVKPAHQNTSTTVNAAIQAKPPMPHEQVSPGKTLQEKLAEKQKMMPKSSSFECGARPKIGEAKRSLSFASSHQAKPAKILKKDDVIVLDDD